MGPSFAEAGSRPEEAGAAPDPLVLCDPSGRTLELHHQEDGSVKATVRFSPLISWSVTVQPEQVAQLREWLG